MTIKARSSESHVLFYRDCGDHDEYAVSVYVGDDEELKRALLLAPFAEEMRSSLESSRKEFYFLNDLTNDEFHKPTPVMKTGFDLLDRIEKEVGE